MQQFSRTATAAATLLRRVVASLAVAALTAGCAVMPPSVAGFRDTTLPVSVGPVERIGGAAHEPELTSVRTFREDATNLYRYTSSAGGGGTVHRSTESAGVFDVAIEKALDDCNSCRVRVGEIYAGSHAAVLLGTSDDTHWTGAELELYRAPQRRGRR